MRGVVTGPTPDRIQECAAERAADTETTGKVYDSYGDPQGVPIPNRVR
jgi:hypothetical protein